MVMEQRCTVIGLTPLNESTYWLDLEAGKMVAKGGLHAGQFLHVKCGDAHLLRRPISVALWMEDEPEDTVALSFEVRGEGTRWLSERAPGDQLDVLGPLGNGFTMGRGRYLLVGGGIGVPPLLGCAGRGGEQTTAVLGFRSKDRAILVDRFEECCRDVLVCTDDGSLGKKEFVDGLVREELEKHGDYAGVLACGPTPMLRAVARAAAKYHIPCQVSMEERMACGVGACLVCACKMKDGHYRHVCKDGPVFDAQEVDWDG